MHAGPAIPGHAKTQQLATVACPGEAWQADMQIVEHLEQHILQHPRDLELALGGALRRRLPPFVFFSHT